MSTKRNKLEREFQEVRAMIWNSRPPLCESCGCNQSGKHGQGTQLALSHIVGKGQDIALIADENNITIACTECHIEIEARRFEGLLNEEHLTNYFQNYLEVQKEKRL